MAPSLRADCAPWAFGTSLPQQPRLGRMALPNADRIVTNKLALEDFPQQVFLRIVGASAGSTSMAVTCGGGAVHSIRRGHCEGLDAAVRSGKLGPVEAECFADLANRTRVEIMTLTN